MKKSLLSMGAILALTVSTSLNAQVDTLNEFFTGTMTAYTTTAGGYVSGSNEYGDVAKMQLFDATHGVTAGGTITSVLLAMPFKADAGGSYTVAIWGDVAGAPGTVPLATVTKTIASIDTTFAAFTALGLNAAYNVTATFTTPVAIPAGSKFWAGVILPVSAGDSVALLTNTDGDFADAITHTGEIWGDGSFNNFNSAWNGLDVALAIFPVVNFVTSGLEENGNTTVSVYPNPANEALNFNLNGKASSISILSLEGKLISSTDVNGNFASINVSGLTSGVYMYQVKTSNGAVVTNKFVKK